MMNKIVTIIVGILLITINAFAQDVKIDGSGNVTAGSSNIDANLEVIGSVNEDAVVGSASGSGSGVYGINTEDNNYGTLGSSASGVYGESSTGDAGYFQGSVRVTGALTLDTSVNLPANSTIGGLSLPTGPHTVDTKLDEPTVEGYITNGTIDLNANTTVAGASISTGSHTVDTTLTEVVVQNYIKNGPIDLHTGTTVGGAAILSRYGKVAIVAKTGGDYINPVDAMVGINDWCGTPSEINRCLLKVMPGVYDITVSSNVVMQPYVDLEGSGESVTMITSASVTGFGAGVVNCAANSEIRFITIQSTAGEGGTVATAIYNSGNAIKLTNVTASCINPLASCYGVFNDWFNPTSHTIVLNNVTIDSGGTGLSSGFGAKVVLNSSRIIGTTYYIDPGDVSSTSLIMNSQVEGAIDLSIPIANRGTVNCFGVYDSSLGAPSSICP